MLYKFILCAILCINLLCSCISNNTYVDDVIEKKDTIVGDDLKFLAQHYLEILNTHPNRVFTDQDIAYPVTEMTGMLMYWKITKDIEFYNAALRQRVVCLSYLTSQNLPKYSWYPYHTRDAIARDIIMWYLAYKITSDISYLRIAEKIAYTFRNLERKLKLFEGHLFMMFGREYDTSSLKYIGGGSIDPNQNMEIALAFGYLYYEPMATIKNGANFDWYLNRGIKDIIDSEMEAALLLRDDEGRFYMEEGESNRVFDTVYWEYTTVLMMMYYEISHDEKIGIAIRESGLALKKYHSNITDINSLYDKSDNVFANNNNGDDLFTRTMIFDYLKIAKPEGWNRFVYGHNFFNSERLPINCFSKEVKPVYEKMALLIKFFLYPPCCGMPIMNFSINGEDECFE